MRRLLALATAATLGTLLLFAAPAAADKYTGPPGHTPTVGAVEQGGASGEAPGETRVLGSHFTRASNGTFLAFTGADIAGLVGIALMAIAAGTVLVQVRRRHPQPA